MRPCEGHVALVLAAGRGTRMGGPKALMDVRGEAWWRVQRSALEAVPISSAWVVSRAVLGAMGADAPRCVVADEGAPMFESVLRGLREVSGAAHRGVFVLPVDVPAPGPGTWHALASSEAPVSAPIVDGVHGHPLLLRREVCEELLRRDDAGTIAGPDRRLDVQVEGLVRRVSVDDARATSNLNTPGDVERFLDS